LAVPPPHTITPRRARLLVLVLILGFAGLGSLWIARPGLYYDEVLFIQATYARDDVPIAYMMHIRGRPVALMLISYLGALKGWLYIPLVKLLEPSAALVRVPMLLAGAAALGFFYLFGRRAFGWQVALGATALAATDPIYLFTTRQDWGPVALQRLFLAAGCWAVLRWWQQRRTRDLFWGGFAFGVGVFDKATMLWLLAALSLAAAMVYTKAAWSALRTRAAAVAVAGLVAGSVPFLYYCKKWPGETFRQGWESPAKFAEKVRGVQYTLEGTILIGWFTRDSDANPAPPPDALARLVYELAPRGHPFAKTWLLGACIASLLLLPALPFHPWGRGMLFLLVFTGATFAQMLVIRNAGAAHHLALLLPFPQLFVAAGLGGLRARLEPWMKRAAPVAMVLVFVALAGANLRAVAHHYYRILAFGGGSGWSEAIYPLHQTLERARAKKIFVLDWGIVNQLRWLSRDRLPLVEGLQPQGPEDEAPYLWDWLEQPDVLWVKPAAEETPAFPQIVAAWRNALAARGLRPEVVETVRDLRGRPVYEVMVVKE
jgi:hypothetical protein